MKCDFDSQIQVLMNCLNLIKSGRAGGCDLKGVGGKNSSGVMTLGANLSSCKYSCMKILDYSPAGLHVSSSINILELL